MLSTKRPAHIPAAKFMKPVYFGFFISLSVFTFSFGSASRADDASAPGETNPVDQQMQLLATQDPMVHAVFRDHPDESRKILEKATRTGNWVVGRDESEALIRKYGAFAVVRAGNAYILGIARSASEMVEAFSIYDPPRCRDFLLGQLPNTIAVDPNLSGVYIRFSNARRLAYEDGKARPEAILLSKIDLGLILVEQLKTTDFEMDVLVRKKQSSDRRICQIFLKLYDVSKIKFGQRSAYARKLISLGVLP